MVKNLETVKALMAKHEERSTVGLLSNKIERLMKALMTKHQERFTEWHLIQNVI